MRKKESFEGFLLSIKLEDCEELPYFGNFLNYIDASKGSVRCNLYNYIKFLKTQTDIWYKLCRITRQSLDEYIREACPACYVEEIPIKRSAKRKSR